MDVRCLTVGPVAENCYLVRGDGAEHALIVDPGEEPDRILSLVDELGVKVDAILLTHTHFDHVGAVAPVARATGAPVYCPELEVPVLADIQHTPGHSPGHLTYSIPAEAALFSGDVLFQGSVGRVDLPGGDGPTLMKTLRSLAEGFPEETTVYPGHMGITTLGSERATNPFLAELAR